MQEEERNRKGNVLKGSEQMDERGRRKGIVCFIGGGATVSALGTKEPGGRKVT